MEETKTTRIGDDGKAKAELIVEDYGSTSLERVLNALHTRSNAPGPQGNKAAGRLLHLLTCTAVGLTKRILYTKVTARRGENLKSFYVVSSLACALREASWVSVGLKGAALHRPSNVFDDNFENRSELGASSGVFAWRGPDAKSTGSGPRKKLPDGLAVLIGVNRKVSCKSIISILEWSSSSKTKTCFRALNKTMPLYVALAAAAQREGVPATDFAEQKIIFVPDHVKSRAVDVKERYCAMLEGRMLAPRDCVVDDPTHVIDTRHTTVGQPARALQRAVTSRRVLQRYYGLAKREWSAKHAYVMQRLGVPTTLNTSEYLALARGAVEKSDSKQCTVAALTIVLRVFLHWYYTLLELERMDRGATDTGVVEEDAAGFVEAVREGMRGFASIPTRGLQWARLSDEGLFLGDAGRDSDEFHAAGDGSGAASLRFVLDSVPDGLQIKREAAKNLPKFYDRVLGVPKLSRCLVEAAVEPTDPSAYDDVESGSVPAVAAAAFIVEVWMRSKVYSDDDLNTARDRFRRSRVRWVDGLQSVLEVSFASIGDGKDEPTTSRVIARTAPRRVDCALSERVDGKPVLYLDKGAEEYLWTNRAFFRAVTRVAFGRQGAQKALQVSAYSRFVEEVFKSVRDSPVEPMSHMQFRDVLTRAVAPPVAKDGVCQGVEWWTLGVPGRRQPEATDKKAQVKESVVAAVDIQAAVEGIHADRLLNRPRPAKKKKQTQQQKGPSRVPGMAFLPVVIPDAGGVGEHQVVEVGRGDAEKKDTASDDVDVKNEDIRVNEEVHVDAKRLGRWGEHFVFQQLKKRLAAVQNGGSAGGDAQIQSILLRSIQDAKDQKCTVVWANEDGESMSPYDIAIQIGGQRVLEFEVKTMKRTKRHVNLSVNELLRCVELKSRYVFVIVRLEAAQPGAREPRVHIAWIPNPLEAMQKRKLQLAVVAPRGWADV